MAILIQTSSQEEQSLLESLLRKMKISFENTETNQKVNVSEQEMQSIEKGLNQAKNGLLNSSENVHRKAKLLCSK
ncbi:hypothetical protein SAMN05421847_1339 [Halpernia humi]|uniref:Uncharacterized protein n=1 Tax=Halpernia humi TaxID=493375 RepID=A0A1H5WV54_9FLAO|nr:hypothetical protein [Halpernia humi]SEG03120.1 hypothetical protein SAMN05421847_1339 [Halpernia humi]